MVATEAKDTMYALACSTGENEVVKASVGEHLGSLWPIIVGGALFNISLTAAAYKFQCPSELQLVVVVFLVFGASLVIQVCSLRYFMQLLDEHDPEKAQKLRETIWGEKWSMANPCIPRVVIIFFVSVPALIDGILDGNQAGGADQRISSESKERFIQNWQSVEWAGELIERIGLPGVLFGLVVFFNTVQLVCVLAYCAAYFKRFDYRSFSRTAFAADFAGLPFLGEAMYRIVHMEILEMEDQGRNPTPPKDRNGKTVSKMAEDGSMIWFLISLLGLTWAPGTPSFAINVLSIVISFVGLGECIADLRLGAISAPPTKICGKDLPTSAALRLTAMAFLVVWWIVNMIRFVGTFYCPSHTLQLYGGVHCAGLA